MGCAAAREVLSGLEWADEILDDVSRGPRRSVLQAASLVRQGRYDLAVLLPNSFRSALVARLAGVKRRLGYARDGRGFLLTDRLEAPRHTYGRLMPVPAISYYLSLIGKLGCPADDRGMQLAVEKPFAAAAQEMLEKAGVGADDPLVIINPGASFGSSKLWPVDRFAAVADRLYEQSGARIVVNCGPHEQEISGAMEAAMRHKPAISMAHIGPSLGILKALAARGRDDHRRYRPPPHRGGPGLGDGDDLRLDRSGMDDHRLPTRANDPRRRGVRPLPEKDLPPERCEASPVHAADHG